MHGLDLRRTLRRHIEPEMLALLVTEGLLSVALAYSLLLSREADAGGMAVVNHALLVAVGIGLTSSVVGLYRPHSFMRIRTLMFNTALGGGLAFGVVAAICYALRLDRLLVGTVGVRVVVVVLTWIAALAAVRLAFLVAVRARAFVRPVAVLGDPSLLSEVVAAVRTSRAGFIEVVAAGGGPAGLRRAGVRTAVVGSDDARRLCAADRAGYAAAGVEVLPEPAFWERHLKRVDTSHLEASWFAALNERPVYRLGELARRLGDIAISLGLLAFTLPLMGLVAVIVRLESPGPALYRQERVGLHGRPFVLLKFRSMRADAERSGPIWAQQGDTRVTRVGGLMRRMRIDELPQVLNVLRGEMAFIGPRPERPHFVDRLAQDIPHYRERARVKPGLTGWAQVNYPYGASVEDARAKLSFDLFYVKYRGPWLDLAIMFATLRVILFQEGSR